MAYSEPLELRHQDLVSIRLHRMGYPLSEYSFADSYLFRGIHHYELLHGAENLYLRGFMRSGQRYLMPLQIIPEIDIRELMLLLATEADFLFPIPKKWRTFFMPEYFDLTFDEGDSDYVYTVEKMRYYPGRRLSGKRNLVKQFLENYAPISYPLTVERRGDAEAVLESWRGEIVRDDETDYDSCREALALWGQLKGLRGCLYYLDGRPIGLLIGEPLTPRIFVIRFLKALKEYKGIYQYIYQAFARQLEEQFFFLNLEQDLDIPALKQAKNSYVPDCHCQKLRVALSPKIVDSVKKGELPPSLTWPNVASVSEECTPC